MRENIACSSDKMQVDFQNFLGRKRKVYEMERMGAQA